MYIREMADGLYTPLAYLLYKVQIGHSPGNKLL